MKRNIQQRLFFKSFKRLFIIYIPVTFLIRAGYDKLFPTDDAFSIRSISATLIPGIIIAEIVRRWTKKQLDSENNPPKSSEPL
jgi:hypothetical protein